MPVPGRGSLANRLACERPSFAAYLVSFFVIGILWVNHYGVLYNVARVDRAAMSADLLLLMFVTAIPRSTATLGEYLHHGGRDAHLAAGIYGLAVPGVALRRTALCAWAARRRPFHASVPGRRAASSARRFAARPVTIAAAIGVAS